MQKFERVAASILLQPECAALVETDPQQHAWAGQMQDFLQEVQAACHDWQRVGLSQVPSLERDEWVARYFEILAEGYAAHPPPLTSPSGKAKGRPKHSKAPQSAQCSVASG